MRAASLLVLSTVSTVALAGHQRRPGAHLAKRRLDQPKARSMDCQPVEPGLDLGMAFVDCFFAPAGGEETAGQETPAPAPASADAYPEQPWSTESAAPGPWTSIEPAPTATSQDWPYYAPAEATPEPAPAPETTPAPEQWQEPAPVEPYHEAPAQTTAEAYAPSTYTPYEAAPSPVPGGEDASYQPPSENNYAAPAPLAAEPTPAPVPSPAPQVEAPAPAPAPVPSPAPVAPVVNAAVANSDADRYLAAHNTFRAKYGASALTWSTEAAAAAQKWANNCKWEHSQGAVGSFGENLAVGTGDGFTIEAAIKMWTDEAADYNPASPQYSHFTQVVWKGTSQLGCAVAQCDGIYPASYGKASFYVCEYSAPGNVIGQFAQNVGTFQG